MQKIATLQYAGAEGVIENVDLYADVPEGWAFRASAQFADTSGTGKNEIRGNRITLWTSDGNPNPTEAFAGFGIKLTVYGENSTEISVPFANDRFDLAATRVPSGFRLVRAD